MRSDDAVLGLQQGIVAVDGLRGHHVQRGGSHLAGVQSVRQVLLHYHLATAVVDDDDAVLHLGNVLLVDDAGVEGEQGHLQTQHVGLGEQLVQRHVFHAQSLGGLALPGIIGDDPHAQSFGDLGGVDADVAAAQQAVGLASQLDEGIVPVAPVGAVLPLAGVDGVAVVADVVADLQQQGDGELADGTGAVHRHVGHADALLLGIGDVDDVVAGGQHGDVLDAGAGVKGPAADGGLVGDDHLGVADAGDDLLFVGEAGAVIDRQIAQLVQSVPAEIAGVLRVSVQYHDLHSVLLLVIKNFNEWAVS